MSQVRDYLELFNRAYMPNVQSEKLEAGKMISLREIMLAVALVSLLCAMAWHEQHHGQEDYKRGLHEGYYNCIKDVSKTVEEGR